MIVITDSVIMIRNWSSVTSYHAASKRIVAIHSDRSEHLLCAESCDQLRIKLGWVLIP